MCQGDGLCQKGPSLLAHEFVSRAACQGACQGDGGFDTLTLCVKSPVPLTHPCNQQPWEFYVAAAEDVRNALAQASRYATPCTRAPLVLAFCLREQLRFPTMVAQDMGACVENALIRVAELGLGAVWMGIYPEKERMAVVREVLGLSDGTEAFALVAVGHPAVPVKPQGPTRFDEGRIHWL